MKPYGGAFKVQVDRFKADLIRATLLAHGGSRTRAAETLGLQRTYLIRLIRQFGVDVPARIVRLAKAGSCIQ